MPINITRKKNADSRTPFQVTSPYDNRYGFWAVVTEVHPEDMTVHVRMDTGFELSGVRVASMEWVTIDDNKDYLSGERHLPPVNTYVFCMCPNGEISTAFVLCSGFLIHQAKHSAFKEKGKENSYKTVENSGWVEETDYKTGTKTIKNKPKDETVSIEVNQETKGQEKVTVKIHGTEIIVDKNGGVSIVSDKDISVSCNKATVSSNGDIKATAKGNISVETSTGNAEVKAMNIKATATGSVNLESSTAGQLKIGNSIGSLGGLISDFIQDVSSAILVTPTGPGSLDPKTIAKLTALLVQWKSVFS